MVLFTVHATKYLPVLSKANDSKPDTSDTLFCPINFPVFDNAPLLGSRVSSRKSGGPVQLFPFGGQLSTMRNASWPVGLIVSAEINAVARFVAVPRNESDPSELIRNEAMLF